MNSIEKDKKQQDYNSCHLFLLLGCAFFMGKITSGSLLLHMRQCNTWPYVANQDVFFQATRKHTKSCLYQPNLLPLSLLHCPENFADTSWANFTFIWYIKYHCRALGRRRMKLLKSLVFLSMRFQILYAYWSYWNGVLVNLECVSLKNSVLRNNQ